MSLGLRHSERQLWVECAEARPVLARLARLRADHRRAIERAEAAEHKLAEIELDEARETYEHFQTLWDEYGAEYGAEYGDRMSEAADRLAELEKKAQTAHVPAHETTQHGL